MEYGYALSPVVTIAVALVCWTQALTSWATACSASSAEPKSPMTANPSSPLSSAGHDRVGREMTEGGDAAVRVAHDPSRRAPHDIRLTNHQDPFSTLTQGANRR